MYEPTRVSGRVWICSTNPYLLRLMPSVVSDDRLIEIHPNPLPACFADSNCNTNPLWILKIWTRYENGPQEKRRVQMPDNSHAGRRGFPEAVGNTYAFKLRWRRFLPFEIFFPGSYRKISDVFRLRQAGKPLFPLFLSLSPCTELASASLSSFFPRWHLRVGWKNNNNKTTSGRLAFTFQTRRSCFPADRGQDAPLHTAGWVCVEAAETLLPRRIRWTLSIPRIPASVGRRPVSRRVLRACSRECIAPSGTRTVRATTQDWNSWHCWIIIWFFCIEKAVSLHFCKETESSVLKKKVII